MFNNFRKMLRNEKGFTLVELLAVIVILGIIVAIAVPAIGNIIESARTDAEAAQEELILDAARLADVEGNFTSGTTTEWSLIDGGYLEASNEDLSALDADNVGRKIYKNNATYTFNDPS